MSKLVTPAGRGRGLGVSFEEVERSWANFLDDLCMFVSLQLALLMVWRITRLRAKKELCGLERVRR